MKTIMLLVHDDVGQEARFRVALDIARAMQGHLKCFDVSIVPLLVGDDPAVGQILLADERQRGDENRIHLEERLGRANVPWDWTDATGLIGLEMEAAIALADLIVVNRRLDAFPVPDMRAIASDLVLRSGKPVLAAPDHATGLNVAGRALVCWDGSACACAALRAAVPLLRLSSHVILLEIEDDEHPTTVDDAAEYLARYDIHALVRRRHPLMMRPADAILDAVRLDSADYVVMGGFSHLRLYEALFGGVTRTMLSASPVPVFMAH